MESGCKRKQGTKRERDHMGIEMGHGGRQKDKTHGKYRQ